jgi:CBS domain-containing protein
MKNIPVRDLMTRDVVTGRPDMPLREAVSLLRRNHLRSLPVTDSDEGLVGVLSETDVFLKPKGIAFSLETAPSLLGQVIDREQIDQVERARSVRVDEVMSTCVTTVDPDTRLEDLAMLMHERQLTCLPVLDGERLVGVVSRIDVLEVIYDSLA